MLPHAPVGQRGPDGSPPAALLRYQYAHLARSTETSLARKRACRGRSLPRSGPTDGTIGLATRRLRRSRRLARSDSPKTGGPGYSAARAETSTGGDKRRLLLPHIIAC